MYTVGFLLTTFLQQDWVNYDTWWMEPVPSAVIESYNYYCVHISCREWDVSKSHWDPDQIPQWHRQENGYEPCRCDRVCVCVCVCGSCDRVCVDHVIKCVGIMWPCVCVDRVIKCGDHVCVWGGDCVCVGIMWSCVCVGIVWPCGIMWPCVCGSVMWLHVFTM